MYVYMCVFCGHIALASTSETGLLKVWFKLPEVVSIGDCADFEAYCAVRIVHREKFEGSVVLIFIFVRLGPFKKNFIVWSICVW